MNYTRILLGGLLAGVVINLGEFVLWGVVLREQNEAMLAAHGLTEASWAIAGYVATGFILGIVLAWLYAAIRPRYGAGWQTAAVAAAAVWVVAWILPLVWFGAMGLGIGTSMAVIALIWGLVELVLAGVAAGWAYQEEGATAGSAAMPAM